MNAVFDPSLLFISDFDWLDDEKRDVFLECLESNLNYIDKYDICDIIWTEEFDILMWEIPQLNPWKQEYWSAMQIIPNIYKKLNNRLIRDYFCSDIVCSMKPDFSYIIKVHSVHDFFLKLIHTLIEFEVEFYLNINEQNKLIQNRQYTFSCLCHNKQYSPVLINQANDWLNSIDIVDKFFPKNKNEFDEKFVKGMELIRLRNFSNYPYINNQLYRFDFEFTSSFIESIVGRNKLQIEIFNSIVKKLIFTSQESRDSDLDDKYLEQLDQFAIRVSNRPTSTRIHYFIDNANKIIFIRYYGIGEYKKRRI
jgi:hypothetical protein